MPSEHLHEIINYTSIPSYVLISAILVAIAAGILGCFVVWRKMAYFGDSLSHSALLGLVVGIVFGISSSLGIIIICTVFAALILWMQSSRIFANDTILGILAHSAIALGMVVLSLIKYKHHVDEHALLFGELLRITEHDFIPVLIGVGVVLVSVYIMWSKFVISSINEDLAQGEGINTFTTQLIFTALITITVAVSIKIVGIILVTSLMIIPAATARQISRSPKQMAMFSALTGVVSVISGLMLSVNYALPSGPAIVVCSTGCFALVAVLKHLK